MLPACKLFDDRNVDVEVKLGGWRGVQIEVPCRSKSVS